MTYNSIFFCKVIKKKIKNKKIPNPCKKENKRREKKRVYIFPMVTNGMQQTSLTGTVAHAIGN